MIFLVKRIVFRCLVISWIALCTIVSADQVDVFTVQESRPTGFSGIFTGDLDNRGLATTPEGKLLSIDFRIFGYYATCSNDNGATWTGIDGDSTCTFITTAGSHNTLPPSYHFLGSDNNGNGYIVTLKECAGGPGFDAEIGVELYLIKLTPNGTTWNYGNSILLDTRSRHCINSGSILEDETGRLWSAFNYTDSLTKYAHAEEFRQPCPASGRKPIFIRPWCPIRDTSPASIVRMKRWPGPIIPAASGWRP